MKRSDHRSFMYTIIAWILLLTMAFPAAARAQPTEAMTVQPAHFPTVSSTFVISQFQVAGSTAADEFVELHNISASSQDLNGYTLVYRSAAGISDGTLYAWSASTVVPAGGYFLIASTPGYDGAVSPDATFPDTGTGRLAGAGGGLGLRLGPATTGTLIDSLGFGTATNAFVETATTSAPTANNSKERLGNRCQDTDNNNADFTLVSPSTPRNLSGPADSCAASPAFTLSKSAPGLVSPSQDFTYTLAFTNTTGAPATGVTVTDWVPAGLTFVSASDGGALSGGVVTWDVGAMAAGDSASRTFVVTAPATPGTVITNDTYAVYSTEQPTPVTGAPVQTTVSPLDLLVGMTGPGVAFSGENFGYTITVTAQGTADAAVVQLVDTLPAGVTYVSDDSGVTPTGGPSVYTWDLGTLAAGTSRTIHLQVTTPAATPSGALLNQVSVATTTSGDDPANNSAAATTNLYQIVPIATARAGATGQVFAVEGRVTVQPGTYSGSEWELQDASGGISAYYSPAPSVVLGDLVRLVAPLGGYNGQEQFGIPLYFANLASGPEVTPLTVTTGEVASGSTEGWLVYLEGDVTSMEACPGVGDFDVYLDDGSGETHIFVDRDTGINLCARGVKVGSHLRVTGFSTVYRTDFEVKPRRSSDVVLVADNPLIAKTAPVLVAPGGTFTYTLRVDNFLDYALTNVVVSDTVPANTTFAYALDGGVETSGVVHWLVSSLPSQGSAVLRFAVTAPAAAGTTVTNEAYSVAAQNFITPTFGASVVTAVDTGMRIHTIQGSGLVSPFLGQAVSSVPGVVTDIKEGTSGVPNGFFMQDPNPDPSPETSEGIWVYTGSAPTVSLGDEVTVSGVVDEFAAVTQIKTPTVGFVSSGQSITAIPVTLPLASVNEWEQYEGMLVSFTQTLTVDQNYFQDSGGQVTLSLGRMYNPTNGNGLGDTFEYNQRRMIVLDDNSSQSYPNPVPYIGQDNTSRAGDSLSNLVGVVDYGSITSSASFYLIQPVGPVNFTRVNDRTPAPEAVGGNIKVASFNVLNYFNGDGQGGGWTDPNNRGANNLAEFERQRAKIISATIAIDADVFGLMEIENDGAGPLSAIQDLVDGMNAIAGAGTYAFVVEPAPGTDAIKVAMLYKPGSVTPFGLAQNYQDTTGQYGYPELFDRPPLAQTFTANATGQTFTVMVNHFKSKGSCPATGPDADQGDGQGCWNAKRVAQAHGVMDFISLLQTQANDHDVLVIGDLNSYGAETPLLALTAAGLTDELAAHVPAVSRYSYIFDGFSGYLDQALATPSLNAQVSGVTVWHINADEPKAIDYNTENKHPDYYTSSPYRASDHDPVIVGLNLVYPVGDADFGDLPASYGVAWHHTPHVLWLGTSVSDDLTFSTGSLDPQDDGIARGPANLWQPGSPVTLTVNVYNNGGSGLDFAWLSGWIDWDNSGVFEPGELVVNQTVPFGPSPVSFVIPLNYGTGTRVNARFRLYESMNEPGVTPVAQRPAAALPGDGALGGEVEDYQWSFGPTAVTLQVFSARQAAAQTAGLLALALLGLGGLALFWRRARLSR